MKRLVILIFLITFAFADINAGNIFHKNKFTLWGDAGGFIAGSDVGWHGNTFGIIDKSGDNKIGSGPGGGFRVRVNGRFKLFGLELSETWGTLSDLTEYDGKKTQKGDGSINTFDAKVGLIPFTGKKSNDQSYLFVFAGLNHKTGIFNQKNNFYAPTPKKENNLKAGGREFSSVAPLIGIQDVTMIKIAKDLYLGPVTGFVFGWVFPGDITTPDKTIKFTQTITANFQVEFGARLAFAKQFYFQTSFRLDVASGEHKEKNDTYVLAHGIAGFFFTAGYYFEAF
jgi:hypothetical protein